MKGLLARTVTAVSFAAAVCAAQAAQAQVMCAPREAVIERLKSGYGENLTGVGFQSTAQVLEIWAAPATGTWTVLMSMADGKACVVASGTNWQDIKAEPMVLGVPG